MSNTDFENELKGQYRQLGTVLDNEQIITEKTVKQYKNIRIRLHLLDWILYTVVVFGIGVLVHFGISSIMSGKAIYAVVALLAVLLAGYSFSMTPRSLVLLQEKISIRLWIGKVEMRYEDIRQAEMMTYAGNNLRLCGYGGVKAAIGWFWNSKVGVYKAFVNRREDSILITMKSGKKIAFSSANPEEVIDAIRSNINRC